VHGSGSNGNVQNPDPDDATPPAPPGWFKARRSQLEQRFFAIRDQVEARRSTSTPIAVAFDTFGRDSSAGGSVLAAALGFRIFLFYVPYIFFFAFAFGLGADAAERSPEDLARSGGMGAVTAQWIKDAADLSLFTRIVTVVLTAYALFAGARGVVKVLRVVHGLVWDVPVPRLRRSWRGALLFIALTTVAFVLTFLVSALRSRVLIGGIVAMAIYVLIPFVVWLGVSWLLPRAANTDVWALVPGAALFGVGVEVLHLVTVLWIPHLVSSRSERYGAIGIALVLLFWAYLLGRIITLAAVLNAALHLRREAQLPGAPPAPEQLNQLLARAGGLIGRRRARRAAAAATTGSSVRGPELVEDALHPQVPDEVPDDR
jgi:uncharacterized BrkB/YihY/UPF0761 family membrane protein